MDLTTDVFASMAYEFGGSLWLSKFHGGLKQLMTAAWGSIYISHIYQWLIWYR